MPLTVQCNLQPWGTFRAMFNEESRLFQIFLPGSEDKVSGEDITHYQWEEEASREFTEFLHVFFSGKAYPEMKFPLELDGYTVFEIKVLHCLRNIAPGQRVSYSRLADMAGHEKAARAVGNVMRKNRFPLYFPCHRVILSSGDIGGFAGERALKSRLLEHETNIINGKDKKCCKK